MAEVKSNRLGVHFVHGAIGRFAALARTAAVGLLSLGVALTPLLAQQTLRRFPLKSKGEIRVSDAALRVEEATFLGRRAIKLNTEKLADILAFVEGASLKEGTIEVDLAVKPLLAPAPVGRPLGFVGISWFVTPDATGYEAFYFRSSNQDSEDQFRRNRTVQYVALPKYTFSMLRRDWPGTFEGYGAFPPNRWHTVKIEVRRGQAKLFLNGDAQPTFVTMSLAPRSTASGVALWVAPYSDCYFSNLRIVSAPSPQPGIASIAGEWSAKLEGERAPTPATFKFEQTGTKLTGTMSSPLFGDLRPLTGTFQNELLEVEVDGQDPATRTAVKVRIVGRPVGSDLTGRIRGGAVESVWSATRK